MKLKEYKIIAKVGDIVEISNKLYCENIRGEVGEINKVGCCFYLWQDEMCGSVGEKKPAEKGYKYSWVFSFIGDGDVKIIKGGGEMPKVVGTTKSSVSSGVTETKKEAKVVKKVKDHVTAEEKVVIKVEPELTKEQKIEKLKKAREEMKLIGLDHEKKALELGIENNFPVLLIGETGIGKTYVLQHLAKEKNQKVVRISLNGEIGINELLGKWLVKEGSTYWQDGVLVECMRKGYWVILDEINAALPEVLFCLNSLLDDARSIVIAEKDGELVKPHENFRLFATMNPPGEYTGTKELNKALLSRFAIVLYMKEYTPELELKILKYQSCIGEVSARIMVDVANAIRKAKEKQEIWYTCSTRDLVNWARLFSANGNTLEETFCFSILNKAPVEDREVIEKYVKDACSIDFKWNWKYRKVEKLTDLLKVDIEKLESKKQKLKDAVDELVNKAEKVKEAV